MDEDEAGSLSADLLGPATAADASPSERPERPRRVRVRPIVLAVVLVVPAGVAAGFGPTGWPGLRRRAEVRGDQDRRRSEDGLRLGGLRQPGGRAVPRPGGRRVRAAAPPDARGDAASWLGPVRVYPEAHAACLRGFRGPVPDARAA